MALVSQGKLLLHDGGNKVTNEKQKALRDYLKAEGARHRDMAEEHDMMESHFRQAGDDKCAGFHKRHAEFCRKGAANCERAAGEIGSVVVSEEDGSAKSAHVDYTRTVDLLQKDRSSEFGTAPVADPIGALVAELSE